MRTTTANNSIEPGSYFEWEEAVIQQLEQLGMNHSDAQGIMQANPFIVDQSWGLGLGPAAVAAKLMK